jgi:D-glycero-D-manno-heptose 1,7-bisphosphate phosphatase
MRRAAFLDRDGVINVDHGYTWRPEDFAFVPGSLASCAQLHRMGFELVVVTNQSGIGRGLYTEADFARLADWMRSEFASAGAPLTGVYHCPHHPTDAEGTYRRDCDCRKPAPGMLFTAARELDLDLSRSVLFGDRGSDLEAARSASVPERVLLGLNGAVEPSPVTDGLATAAFRSLETALAGSEMRARLEATRHA